LLNGKDQESEYSILIQFIHTFLMNSPTDATAGVALGAGVGGRSRSRSNTWGMLLPLDLPLVLPLRRLLLPLRR